MPRPFIKVNGPTSLPGGQLNFESPSLRMEYMLNINRRQLFFALIILFLFQVSCVPYGVACEKNRMYAAVMDARWNRFYYIRLYKG